MAPRPQLSLCISVDHNYAQVADFCGNITAFFKKFPLQYEVLLASAENPDQSLPANFKWVKVPRFQSRSKNLKRIFDEATGDLLLATNLDLSVPLSESFKILEVFYSHPEIQVVFGDRTQKQKKLEEAIRPVGLQGLEKFFDGVIREKTPWPYHDLFCPVFAIRRAAYATLHTDLKSHGWHWTPEVQRVALQHELRSEEVALYAGASSGQRAPKFPEVLGLLEFILFRI